jgi:hypothetical protein
MDCPKPRLWLAIPKPGYDFMYPRPTEDLAKQLVERWHSNGYPNAFYIEVIELKRYPDGSQ